MSYIMVALNQPRGENERQNFFLLLQTQEDVARVQLQLSFFDLEQLTLEEDVVYCGKVSVTFLNRLFRGANYPVFNMSQIEADTTYFADWKAIIQSSK